MKLKIVLLLAFLIQCLFLKCTKSFRLLGVFPNPASSHYILGVKLMKGFAEAGHDVTFITPYETKDLPKNGSWKDIHLQGLEKTFRERIQNIDLFKDGQRTVFEKLMSYQEIFTESVNKTFFHPKVRALLTSHTKFDVVIMEQFVNDCHKYFAHFYQCPLILMSSIGPTQWVNSIVANPTPIAYVPHVFYDTDSSKELTFLQRLYNLYYHTEELIYKYFYYHPLHNKLLQQAFPGAPSTYELNNYTALILLASHLSLLDAVPLVPNMVEIGGYHIDPPKPLPNDLQEFLNSANEGVIYFSMGSNLKSKDISDEKRTTILSVLGKLKQKVLWKFEDTHLAGKPENVLIKSWFPQQDILAHPNIKLFITHGGFLSISETIYHGVPVLAIPVFADQIMNANKAVQKGYGLKLSYNDEHFNEETLYALIQELLYNPIYTKNAKTRSKIFHTRPLKPMENAVFWMEYVIKFNGAEHLRVAGVNLPLYKYFMVDVLAFLLGAILLCLYVTKFIFTRLFCSTVVTKKHVKKELLKGKKNK